MTLINDARFIKNYGPTIADAVASNLGRSVWSKVRRPKVPAGVVVTDFDPLDPRTASNPYSGYRMLHDSGRVHYNRARDIYILSSFADVRAGLRADDMLSNNDGVNLARFHLPNLLNVDRPVHTRMRKQVLPGFTRPALESWTPMVHQLAGELVDGLLAKPGADVVADLANPMPMRMIMHILGIASADEHAFKDWSNEAIHVANITISLGGLREVIPAIGGTIRMHDFFLTKLAHGELLEPHTMLGRLVENSDGGQINHDELFFFAMLLLLAGNETTTNLLSTLFLQFAENPDQLERLRANPDLIPSAIEEQLRFVSPIQGFYRTAKVDYPVGDTYIPAGSRVLMSFAAANRDPRQFDAPDTYRVDRNPAHVAFGSGIHLCLGAHLARLEGQAILREIVEKVEKIEIVGNPTWTTNSNLRGLAEMKLKLTRRTQAELATEA